MVENYRKWPTSPQLWEKLKPLAQQMRREPTVAENLLWQKLRKRQVNGLKFRRQHAIEQFIVDFCCTEIALVIEVDGGIHQYTQEEDAIRQEFIESIGYRIIRFTNEQVMNQMPIVLSGIVSFSTDLLAHE